MRIRFEMIEIRHFGDWAQKLFKKKNINIPKEIISNIVERSDYRPIYVQQFLFDLWRSATISLEVIDQVEISIITSQKNQFITRVGHILATRAL